MKLTVCGWTPSAASACYLYTIACLLFIFGSTSRASASEPILTAQEIIARMSVHADDYWVLTQEYTFLADILIDDYETDGEIKKHMTLTERIYHYHGRRFFRKLTIDGRPLNADELKEEDTRESKFRARTQKSIAANDSSDIHGRMDESAILIKDLVGRYNYELAGLDTVRGRGVYVVNFTPRDGLKADTRRDKIFNELQGTVWIDTVQFRIMKSVGRLRRNVRIGWIAANIDTVEIHYEQQEIEAGIWMPLFVDARVSGSIFFFKKINRYTSADFYNFEESSEDPPRYIERFSIPTDETRE
jgi:hypothetical protein